MAAEREDALVAAVVKAIGETGAHAGSVFLRSRDGRSIVLAATCGPAPSLLGGWRLIPVNSPIPVAAAYRSGRTVHLADAGETARRYPQLAVALPYAFGSASVPVRAGQESLGALAVVWGRRPGARGCPGPSSAASGPSPTGSAPPSPTSGTAAPPSTTTPRRCPSRSRPPPRRPCGSVCSTGGSTPGPWSPTTSCARSSV
ncbi:GAF domain-containing protein [Kitasatospora aburaviensis]